MGRSKQTDKPIKLDPRKEEPQDAGGRGVVRAPDPQCCSLSSAWHMAGVQ